MGSSWDYTALISDEGSMKKGCDKICTVRQALPLIVLYSMFVYSLYRRNLSLFQKTWKITLNWHSTTMNKSISLKNATT